MIQDDGRCSKSDLFPAECWHCRGDDDSLFPRPGEPAVWNTRPETEDVVPLFQGHRGSTNGIDDWRCKGCGYRYRHLDLEGLCASCAA